MNRGKTEVLLHQRIIGFTDKSRRSGFTKVGSSLASIAFMTIDNDLGIARNGCGSSKVRKAA